MAHQPTNRSPVPMLVEAYAELQRDVSSLTDEDWFATMLGRTRLLGRLGSLNDAELNAQVGKFEGAVDQVGSDFGELGSVPFKSDEDRRAYVASRKEWVQRNLDDVTRRIRTMLREAGIWADFQGGMDVELDQPVEHASAESKQVTPHYLLPLPAAGASRSESSRAAHSLCAGEDSERVRSELRRLARDAGFDRVDGLSRDELCRLLGVPSTGLHGRAAFPSDLSLLKASAAMRGIAGFVGKGALHIVRDSSDSSQIEILTANVPTEPGLPAIRPSASVFPLPSLPDAEIAYADAPAMYFTQGYDVAPGPLVLRVSQTTDDSLVAACVTLGRDGIRLVPRTLFLYDDNRDPRFDVRGDTDMRKNACVFAGLVGASPDRFTAVCLVAHHISRTDIRHAIVSTLHDGSQHILPLDPGYIRGAATMSAVPHRPAAARLTVSAWHDEFDRAESFIIEPGRPAIPDSSFSGTLPSAEDFEFGQAGAPVLVSRPEQEFPSMLKTTSERGIREYVATTTGVFDHQQGRITTGEFGDAAKPIGPRAVANIYGGVPRRADDVPIRADMWPIHNSDHTAVLSDLILMQRGGQPLLVHNGQNMLPLPRADGYEDGIVAVCSSTDPALVSEKDVYAIALGQRAGRGYRVYMVGRRADGKLVLTGDQEFAAAALPATASRRFGVIAEFFPDLERHASAASATRQGLAWANAAQHPRPAAQPSARRPREEERIGHPLDGERGREEGKDEAMNPVLAAALRRRILQEKMKAEEKRRK
jgi:hypothetical protein